MPKAKDDQITERVGPANRADERGLGQDGAGVSPYLLYRMLKECIVLITYNDSQGGKLPTTHREFKVIMRNMVFTNENIFKKKLI